MLLILLGFFLLDPQRAPHQFVLTEYSVEKGLPHSAVCSVLQSQNGYLWVGTQDGLARFDGIQFLEEDFSQSGQHSSPFFNVLTKDPQGRIWAGTRSGGILVWSKAHRVVLGSGTGLSDPQVLCFSPSQAGGMYVGTPSGIFLVDPLLTQVTDLQFWQENRQVVQCMVLWQGQLMIGTDTGLWRLAPDGRPQRTVLDYTSVTALYVDRDDHLWIGTEAVGLLCWAPGDSPVAFERKDNANPQFITAFCQDSDGILWIGTHHQGMFRQYGGQLSRVDFHNRFTESRIFSIIEDREGSLWVGTHFGLVQIQDAAFKLIGKQEGIEEDAIWSIQQGPSGSMLFASEGGGLKIYQAGLIHTIGKDDGLSSSDTISVLTARDGAIWVGTRKGLNRVDKNEIRVFGPEQGLTSDYVRALHEDHSGRIWIGTVAGCFIWDGNHFSILSTSTGLIHNTVRCFFEDDRNTIWIGTDGGISRVFQDGYIQNFSTQNGLLSSFVRCLVPAVDGGVWVGTYGGGLHYFGRDLRIAQLTRQQGLYYDIVFDIVRDEEGWLWGGTSKGIFRAKETDMLAVVRGERDQFSSEVFGEPRNPIRLDVTGGVWPLATRDSSGQIWFPTYRGAVVFNPTIVPKTTAPPKPIIFSFRVDGAERIDQPTPELSPGTDRLEFHYASLTFRAPGKIQYAHKLEGYDQEWVMAYSLLATTISPEVFLSIRCTRPSLSS
ncbi:MAG: hypothetical protein KDC71_10175 [Acidobacteria bacterium]|nr:hypothetical protein [Acidobacteriota bacterium]